MKTIFRAYDIRGIYPSEINEELAEKIGAAFGTMVKGKIVVGMDVRNSGPKLKDALVKGLLSVGVYVIDIGNVTTPMVYFAVVKYGFDGGIIITASHNPSEYNGFKLCGKNAISWSWETGIEKLYDWGKSDQFDLSYKGDVVVSGSTRLKTNPGRALSVLQDWQGAEKVL